MHTRTRSEYKSFVDSVYIQNPITVRPVCQNVLFDAKTDSGDVICIQGRDLSTNHLLILFIQNPISSPITVHPVCQNVSLLLFDANTDIVEMSYAYKDEIRVQIICDSFHPKPNFCQRYCQNVL
jgi:hypothetical protein